MRKPVRLVLFDLGSTLIYEKGPWNTLFVRADVALWHVLRNYGVRLRASEVYDNSRTLFDVYYERHRNDLNEPTIAAVLGDLLRGKGFDLSKEQVREALRAMYAITQTNWLAERDAVPTLEALRRGGFRIGLISNASDDDNTQTLIDKAKVRPYLEYIISSAAFGRRKPDPGIFQAALDFFGIPPEEAVMVGDNLEADIGGAHGLGMQGIWIKRRAQGPFPAGAPTPDAAVHSLAEIPRLLQSG